MSSSVYQASHSVTTNETRTWCFARYYRTVIIPTSQPTISLPRAMRRDVQDEGREGRERGRRKRERGEGREGGREGEQVVYMSEIARRRR